MTKDDQINNLKHALKFADRKIMDLENKNKFAIKSLRDLVFHVPDWKETIEETIKRLKK